MGSWLPLDDFTCIWSLTGKRWRKECYKSGYRERRSACAVSAHTHTTQAFLPAKWLWCTPWSPLWSQTESSLPAPAWGHSPALNCRSAASYTSSAFLGCGRRGACYSWCEAVSVPASIQRVPPPKHSPTGEIGPRLQYTLTLTLKITNASFWNWIFYKNTFSRESYRTVLETCLISGCHSPIFQLPANQSTSLSSRSLGDSPNSLTHTAPQKLSEQSTHTTKTLE